MLEMDLKMLSLRDGEKTLLKTCYINNWSLNPFN
jgi:hypothetical protein